MAHERVRHHRDGKLTRERLAVVVDVLGREIVDADEGLDGGPNRPVRGVFALGGVFAYVPALGNVPLWLFADEDVRVPLAVGWEGDVEPVDVGEVGDGGAALAGFGVGTEDEVVEGGGKDGKVQEHHLELLQAESTGGHRAESLEPLPLARFLSLDRSRALRPDPVGLSLLGRPLGLLVLALLSEDVT